jgi:hypothetical protein
MPDIPREQSIRIEVAQNYAAHAERSYRIAAAATPELKSNGFHQQRNHC